MPHEFLEVLAWVVPIVALVAVAAIVGIRVRRRGPISGPYKKGIHLRRND